VTVIAIGGSACVGKTTCAAGLAAMLGIHDLVHVDDLSSQFQSEGNPHFLDQITNPWRRPPAWLTSELIAWTVGLHPLIVRAVERLGPTGGLIEGEGIDPRLADLWQENTAVVYVVEVDPKALWHTFSARSSSSARFLSLSLEEQRAVVNMNVGYNRWLAEAASRAGQPCVPARPLRTLAERCADVVTASR
jgi:2-phosphoglycerate kinase